MKIRKLTYSFLALAVGVALASSTQAATVFSTDFDTSTGLATVADADTNTTFGYDYSADGIPEAPNSVGGAATSGVKLEANLVGGVAAEVAIATSGLGLTGQYSVQVDVWGNANGPFPGGGAGSTEFQGLSVGHDGVATGRDGASFIYTGEGGSSRDYRLYKNSGEQFFASGQYDAGLLSNNGSDPVFEAAFPGLSAPAAQGQGATVTANGSGGFQWMTLSVDVDTDALGSGATADTGIATFSLTSATSGNTVTVGTVDNSNGGDVVNMSGDVAVVFADLFSSVGSTQFSFGVFDNLVVSQVPEPSSLLLLGMGGLVAGLRRRR